MKFDLKVLIKADSCVPVSALGGPNNGCRSLYNWSRFIF